jgi:hypothetical protein
MQSEIQTAVVKSGIPHFFFPIMPADTSADSNSDYVAVRCSDLGRWPCPGELAIYTDHYASHCIRVPDAGIADADTDAERQDWFVVIGRLEREP